MIVALYNLLTLWLLKFKQIHEYFEIEKKERREEETIYIYLSILSEISQIKLDTQPSPWEMHLEAPARAGDLQKRCLQYFWSWWQAEQGLLSESVLAGKAIPGPQDALFW